MNKQSQITACSNDNFQNVYGYISKNIIDELAIDNYSERNLVRFNLLLYLGILKGYYKNFSVANKSFSAMLQKLESITEIDTIKLEYYSNLILRDEFELKSVSSEVWNPSINIDWVQEWERVCVNEFEQKGYNLEVLLKLFNIVLEQFEIPDDEIYYILIAINRIMH